MILASWTRKTRGFDVSQNDDHVVYGYENAQFLSLNHFVTLWNLISVLSLAVQFCVELKACR